MHKPIVMFCLWMHPTAAYAFLSFLFSSCVGFDIVYMEGDLPLTVSTAIIFLLFSKDQQQGIPCGSIPSLIVCWERSEFGFKSLSAGCGAAGWRRCSRIRKDFLLWDWHGKNRLSIFEGCNRSKVLVTCAHSGFVGTAIGSLGSISVCISKQHVSD